MPNKLNKIDDDQALFEKIKLGDKVAFELLFKKHYAQLVVFAKSFLNDIVVSENVVQGVFVKLWENRNSYQVKSIKGYLMVAVKNGCYNEVQKEKNKRDYHAQISDEELITENEYHDNFVMQKITQVIDQLPQQRKKIFKLNRFEGLKYKEIAELLNLSPKTVESQMGKALKFLRENLLELKKAVYGWIL